MQKGRRLNKIYKSFVNGVDQVKKKDEASFKREAMKKLSLATIDAFDKRSKGQRGHSLAEVEAINSLFKKFGVTDGIWSEPIPEKNK